MRGAAAICLALLAACSSSREAPPDAGADAAADGPVPDVAADLAPDAAPAVPPAGLDQPLALVSSGGRLHDGSGREVLLHGLNARVNGVFDVTFDDGRVALEAIPDFGADDCQLMAEELGLNFLRLPINWSAIEPTPGVYDEAYLGTVATVVDACQAHGVYTLVDLHQDAYSKEIGEDGAPLWAIVPPPPMLLQGPLTDLGDRRTSRPVLEAFDSLFNDAALDDGRTLQQAYAAMAAHVAARFADHPAVVGLELMNEPVLLTSFDRLDTFHARVAAPVRAAAPSLPIFFEPNSLRNLSDNAPVTTPFPDHNAVYAPHIYTKVFVDGWQSMDPQLIATSLTRARAEADRHGAALVVGEMGHDPKTDIGRLWIADTLGLVDGVLASWALWLYEERSQGSWGLYDTAADGTRGALRAPLADLLARPYPERLAGQLMSLAYDPNTRVLTVGLQAAPAPDGGAAAAGLAHVLALPARAYPGGARVLCDGTEVTTQVPRPGRLAFACAGAEIRVEPR
jgi:endoglycosylceramidase